MTESKSGLEDIFIKCPDCGHSAADHNQERFGRRCTGNDFTPDTLCDCQRTYESIINSTMSEPELQLLVIDLDGYCVVKVEKGQGDPLHMLTGRPMYGDGKGTTVITPMPFNKLREAIEQKPVPRIEQHAGTSNYYNLCLPKPLTAVTLSQNEIDALSSIAGKPLPVWKIGTWERLNTHDWAQARKDAGEAYYGIDTFSFEEVICPVKIWRYTK